eukprot:GDKJ01024116.1.p1 GENE.GDKJ01024116.1~~GDKJ01024116.1.p1  ORF type:complete len:633 (-),score=200.79 GDKJ01024116.1:217-2115(-)
MTYEDKVTFLQRELMRAEIKLQTIEDEAASEIEKLDIKIHRLSEKNTLLKDALHGSELKYEEEVATSKKMRADLEEVIKKRDTDIETLRKDSSVILEKKETEFKTLTETLATKEQLIKEQNETISELKKEILKLSEELEKKIKLMADNASRDVVEKLQQQINALQEENAKLKTPAPPPLSPPPSFIDPSLAGVLRTTLKQDPSAFNSSAFLQQTHHTHFVTPSSPKNILTPMDPLYLQISKSILSKPLDPTSAESTDPNALALRVLATASIASHANQRESHDNKKNRQNKRNEENSGAKNDLAVSRVNSQAVTEKSQAKNKKGGNATENGFDSDSSIASDSSRGRHGSPKAKNKGEKGGNLGGKSNTEGMLMNLKKELKNEMKERLELDRMESARQLQEAEQRFGYYLNQQKLYIDSLQGQLQALEMEKKSLVQEKESLIQEHKIKRHQHSKENDRDSNYQNNSNSNNPHQNPYMNGIPNSLADAYKFNFTSYPPPNMVMMYPPQSSNAVPVIFQPHHQLQQQQQQQQSPSLGSTLYAPQFAYQLPAQYISQQQPTQQHLFVPNQQPVHHQMLSPAATGVANAQPPGGATIILPPSTPTTLISPPAPQQQKVGPTETEVALLKLLQTMPQPK